MKSTKQMKLKNDQLPLNQSEKLSVQENNNSDCSVKFGNWANGTRPTVWLISFPRSGNTWTRHLLEVATGIYTGTCYNTRIKKAGVDGKIISQYGQILVYKCHNILKTCNYGILLIRNPYDSILSYYSFLKSGMMGFLPLESYRNSTAWTKFARKKISGWRALMNQWDKAAYPFPVVHYEEQLKRPIPSVERMLNFMNITLTQERLQCLQYNINGKFHRQHPEKFHYDPYTTELHYLIDDHIHAVNKMLESRDISPVHAPAYNREL
ncbi:sialate:O-sulfotransferase 1-like [Saccoglossus kowalevskii]